MADFLIDKFAVDKLCLHLARELFDGTSVMNEHRIPDGPMFADGNIMVCRRAPILQQKDSGGNCKFDFVLVTRL